MKELVIYTTESCDYCKTIKEMLEKENIKFTEKINTDYQKEWHSVVKLTGLGTFPTITINDEYYVPGRDFGSPEQIVGFLKTYQPQEDDFSIELKLMQAFKTMAFSINQGMSRMFNEINKLKDGNESNNKNS